MANRQTQTEEEEEEEEKDSSETNERRKKIMPGAHHSHIRKSFALIQQISIENIRGLSLTIQ